MKLHLNGVKNFQILKARGLRKVLEPFQKTPYNMETKKIHKSRDFRYKHAQTNVIKILKLEIGGVEEILARPQKYQKRRKHKIRDF